MKQKRLEWVSECVRHPLLLTTSTDDIFYFWVLPYFRAWLEWSWFCGHNSFVIWFCADALLTARADNSFSSYQFLIIIISYSYYQY